MHRYWDSVVRPILEITKPKSIVEIGVNEGKNTLQLIEYCEKHNSQLYSIDPYKADILDSYDEHPNFHFVKDISLNALYRFENFDMVLLDGDHNWYTVYHELLLIEKNCDRFPLIIAHDIGWPYGRRDLYYNPELIPKEYLKPYKNDGLVLGTSELSQVGGLNRHLNNCVYENNYKNGVLTAIEDFLSESQQSLKLFTYPAYHGLGIIYSNEYNYLVNHLEKFNVQVLQDLEKIRVQGLLQTSEFKNTNNQLTIKINELENMEILLKREISILKEENFKIEDTLNNVEKTNNQILREKEEILNEKEKAIFKLEEELILSKRKMIELENNILIKDQEIDLHLNSIKYQIGNEFISCYYRPINLLSLPFKLLRLYKDGKNKKNRYKTPSTFVQKKKNEMKYEVSIVICVHNALEDLKICLESLYSKKTVPFNLIIVDDGSDSITKEFLDKKRSKYNYSLFTNDSALGYTISANKGIKVADSRYVILLNSDTIVTYRWLEKLIECMESDESNGIVGPLSNAASWQSVPRLKDGDDWSLNPLNGLTIEQMAKIVKDASNKNFPEVPLINGFCYMISKKVIDTIGLLDEETFPKGYGEEDDYSFRASNAGFKLRVADNCYIYHAKSKSFTPEGRKKIISKSKELLLEKHSKQKVLNAVNLLSSDSYLGNLRSKIETKCSEIYTRAKNIEQTDGKDYKVVVYTAIFGDYDELKEPIVKVDGVDYICFTNNPRVSSEGWKVIHVEEDKSIDLVRNARKVKILAHKYLPDYDYSVWMDANFQILDNPVRLINEHLKVSNLAAFKHSGGRTCVYSEADACIRLGKDDPDIIKRQMEIYNLEGYPEFNGLVETGVLLRKHKEPELVESMELWWTQIQQFSRRDQLSFNYVMWKMNYDFKIIEDYIRDNFCFVWTPHK
ncbi:glycosyltransferase domain-containing protein [Paenibacillus senegalimassiliensis]|uniref:glycosyltransferase domain-containing protein n=1 Tax=Paenibacillus senegalimassiliensis TaxID=1737426 RepID=UPI0009E8FC5F|nr:glycosyltransferase domain-containing protein [Paenibacillus senegalimassiliensis]